MIKHGKLGLEFFIRQKNIIERSLISISNFDIVYSIFNNCNCNKKLALRKTSHNMRGGRELNDWKAASTGVKCNTSRFRIVDLILFRVSEGLRPLSDHRFVKTLILTSDTSLLYV